jgi:hypothetical protein
VALFISADTAGIYQLATWNTTSRISVSPLNEFCHVIRPSYPATTLLTVSTYQNLHCDARVESYPLKALILLMFLCGVWGRRDICVCVWRGPQPWSLFCNPVMNFFFFILMEHRWNEIDREKRKYSGRNCPSSTLSTTNPTRTDPGLNPGLRGERPAINRLSHGTSDVNVFLRSSTVTFKAFTAKYGHLYEEGHWLVASTRTSQTNCDV